MGSSEENRRPGLALVVAVFLSGWLVLAVVKYFALALDMMFPLSGIVLTGIAWLLAATGSAVSAWLATRRPSWRVAAGWAVATIAAIVLMVCVNWAHFYATTWYAMHRSDYAAVLREIDRRGPGEGLPEGVSQLNAGSGQPVWYIQSWRGFLSCSAGFAHFDGSPAKYSPGVVIDSKDYLDDGLGCALHPTVEVGEGWWWVE